MIHNISMRRDMQSKNSQTKHLNDTYILIMNYIQRSLL